MRLDNWTRKSTEGNLHKVCLMNFLDGMWFATPVFVLFLQANSLSLVQIGIILSAYPAMQLLFDIPSSVWADKYSRKNMLILSGICFTLQNVIYCVADSFELLLLGSCLNGIGEAFWSGIFSALIYDSLLSLDREGEYERLQSNVMKSFFLGRLLVCLLGSYIYLIEPRLVFLLSLLSNIANVIVITTLREPSREKSISRSFDQVREGFRYLLRNKTLWNTVVIFSIMAASCELLFNYYQPVLDLAKVPVEHFGLIYVIASLFSFLGAGLYAAIKPKLGQKGTMIAYLLVGITASMLFSVGKVAYVLPAIVLISISFGSQHTFITGIIHEAVPSSHRATALSANGLVGMLACVVLINLVSFTMDRSSIPTGMLANAVIVLIALGIFRKAYPGTSSASERSESAGFV